MTADFHKLELRGKTLPQMEAIIQRAGFEGYRARQLYQWIYKHDARGFDEMINLPTDLCTFLSENYHLGGVEIDKILTAPDDSKKILFALKDGLRTESVLMPEERRWTLCVSTQVGCALGCNFCLTARIKFRRNLTTAEILDQAQYARREVLGGEKLTNIVFMGMGEPLLNLDALIPVLRLLTAPEGIAIPTRRITVSTAGIVPGIYALADADTGVNLAISLNATTDTLRTRIMPINKKYPIAEILSACREFPLAKRRRITFEYVLLKGVNDSIEDAHRLAALVRPIRCKINLICFNEDKCLAYRTSPPETIERFGQYLTMKGYVVAVRHSKGREIKAACGQLAAGYLNGMDK